jgi:hypothetical protein
MTWRKKVQTALKRSREMEQWRKMLTLERTLRMKDIPKRL